MTKPWRSAAALTFLLALTIGLYWQLTFSHDYTWLENPDQGLQVRPWLDYEAREIHAGRLPLWDPYLWGGQSLIGQVQPGVANPLNWILFAMPLTGGHIPVSVLHWYWVLIHWLAAVFTYWLCRDLQCGVVASLVGASIFAFMGFMGHALSPQFLMSALWIPLVLLFFARVFRDYRPWSSAALSGAAMGLAFLSGHHNIPIYTAVLMGVLWVWHVLTGGKALARKAGHAAVFLAVWFLVSAVQSLPAVEYGRVAVRWAGVPEPQRWHDKLPYSVHAENSLDAKYLPGLVIPDLGGIADPYVGIVALALALAALVKRWRSREVRLFAAVAVGGLLLALGKNTPVHWLAYEFIPMVEKARYPAMAIAICQLGIAALAALGLESFGWSKNGWMSGLVLALLLVEVAHHPVRLDRRDRPGSYEAMMLAQSDVADFLKRQPGWFRVEADEDDVPYNFGDWFGIEQFGGYVASMPLRIHMINGHLETPAQLGIRYRIARKPSKTARDIVFESRSGLKVFEDASIPEPLRAVHNAPCEGADQLRIVRRVPGTFVIDANLACAGEVVAGDPWFQGWRAWVDGRRLRIREFEGVVRSVPVENGKHRIEFRYRPGSVYWGAALTLLGLAISGVLWVRERRVPA